MTVAIGSLSAEDLVGMLDRHPDYRVLRRMPDEKCFGLMPTHPDEALYSPPTRRLGAYLDVETTGLDPSVDKIIELGLVKFTFSPETGAIYDIVDEYQSYEDPFVPIPFEIERLTGITDDDVRGHRIDDARVRELLTDVVLTIAHNAEFDRQMAERRFPLLKVMPWACSQRDVEWEQFGVIGQKLDHCLTYALGEFRDGKHRALDDCKAGVRVLARAAVPGTRTPAFSHLLASARTPRTRLYALRAPFPLKEQLKARGYRWSDGETGRPKAWFRDLPNDELANEFEWLYANVYRGWAGPEVPWKQVKLTPYNRHSVRA